MAIGAGQLAKKKAIVSRLTAVEEMAGMDILCSDKVKFESMFVNNKNNRLEL